MDRFSTPGHVRGTWPASQGYAWGGERLVVDTMTVPEDLVDQPLVFETRRDGAYRLFDHDVLLLEGRVGETAGGNGITLRVDRIEAAPGTRFALTRHDLARTAEAVRRGLQVESEGTQTSAGPGSAAAQPGGTVRVGWQYADRQLAAELVNGVTRAYIDGQTTKRREDAAGTLAFLSNELTRVQGELTRAEEALTRYRARTGSLAPSRDAQSFLNNSMEYQRQIAALRLERTRLLQRFTTEANEVRTVDSQIQQMTRERAEIDARMQSLSASERESVALTRDVKVAEDMYMTLRSKVKELVYQEVWGLLLAYNIIRREASQAAVAFGRSPRDIRFKPAAHYIAVQLIVMAAANPISATGRRLSELRAGVGGLFLDHRPRPSRPRTVKISKSRYPVDRKAAPLK